MDAGETFFHAPVKVLFGAGCRKELPRFLVEWRNIAVVSGRSVLDATGMRLLLQESLAGHELHYFCEVEANPSIRTVIAGAAFVRESGCEAVIAIGGGSSLDAAKAICAFAVNRSDFHQLRSLKLLPKQPLPLIAIPTTCGTGSEMNHFAIITDTANQDKLNFATEQMFPKVALLDPELLQSLPEPLVLATAFDALCHAIEGYVSTRAGLFSDTLALAAIERIAATLTPTGPLKSDEMLSSLLYASALGGMVIRHTGTTLLHTLGYYLTNHMGVHHGAANAMMLPCFMQMLAAAGVDRYQHLQSIFAKHAFELTPYIAKMTAAGNLPGALAPDEINAMIRYSIGRRDKLRYNPFPVAEDFLAGFLSGCSIPG